MLRLLVVDDDDIDRRRLKRALREGGLDCAVTEAATVREMLVAADAAEAGAAAFDCVILDYNMPGEDGLAGLTSIRERAPATPVVMVTGQGDETVTRRALTLGASDYIPKDKLDGPELRRTIERAIEKRALERKLERRGQELENFARVLVHDLNAPIRSTSMVASAIQECVADGEIEEIDHYCEQILRLVGNMSALIESLHAHTKLDDEAPLASIEAGEPLAAAIGNLSAVIAEKNAQITQGVMPTIIGSAPQLTQLLQNLIGNALKYCEADTPQVRVEAERTEAGWRFDVIDNGIGVPEQYSAKIFEPFERLHGQSRYAGTGLGLATCRKIVDRHSGRIWCEPAEGGGSIFRFTVADAAKS